MDADRVIVELIAKADGFDGKVAQSATTFEGSMKRIETAGARAEGSLRRTSTSVLQASTAMHRGFEDVGKFLNTSPNSPFVAPVKQAPAVASAMRLVTATSSILGGVLGGIVASGVLAAAAALAEFIMKGKGANAEIAEMVAKLKEQAEKTANAREAQRIFGNTIEGVTEALRKNREILDGLNDSSKTAARLALEEALAQADKAKAIRETNVALLKQAEAQLLVTQAQAATGGGSLRDSGANAEAAIVADRIKSLRTAIAQAEAAVSEANRQTTEALSRRAVELGSEDAVQRIKSRYDKLVESTRQRLVAEGKTFAEIKKQTEALREQQRIAEEAARKKASAGSGQSGRQINVDQAFAIVRSIGGTPTSGFRTVKHNEDVGGVPNSFHTKGQAVDIAKTAGITLAKIVKAFEDQGVRLIEKLDEGDHFHIAFAKRGGTGPSQETLEKRALAEADAAVRREQAFQNEKADLQDEEINLRQSLVTSAEEIAGLEKLAIEKSKQKYAENVQSLVETRKLTADEAKQLLDLNEERAKLRTELVKRREDELKFRVKEADARRAVDAQLGEKSAEADLLQSQEQIATTAKERRDLERRLLDLQFESERIQLQAIIAEYERLKIKRDLTDAERQELADKKVQADLAQQRLDTQPQRQANAQTGNDQANAGPLADYLNQIPDTAMEINEAFESIAAGGLATFTDALTNAIVNFTSLRDVARATLQSIVAGLVKMGIQQLILHTVGASIAAGTTAANVALGATTAAAWAPAAAAVSLATFGANAGPASAGMASTYALSSLLAAPKGFLEGGYTGNGPVGRIAGAVHGQEYVFDAAATRRIGVGNLEAMRNGTVRPSNAAAVAPGGRGGANLSADAVAALRGIVSEAVRAVPDVAVYPTLDPGAVMEAALATSRGRRAFAAHMNDYSGSLAGGQQ